jgi:hypothetical protein
MITFRGSSSQFRRNEVVKRGQGVGYSRGMSKRSAGHGRRVCGGRDGRRSSRVLSRSDVSGAVWFDVTLRVPHYLH